VIRSQHQAPDTQKARYCGPSHLPTEASREICIKCIGSTTGSVNLLQHSLGDIGIKLVVVYAEWPRGTDAPSS
jgi:hypothetical protein